MKSLTFPSQEYSYNDGRLTYQRSESSIIGLIELLWIAIQHSEVPVSRKEARVITHIKLKLREVSLFKDSDEDARVTKPGEQILILEDEELEVLKKLVEANKFTPKVAEDLDSLWNIIDGSKNYNFPKPIKLVNDNPT